MLGVYTSFGGPRGAFGRFEAGHFRKINSGSIIQNELEGSKARGLLD